MWSRPWWARCGCPATRKVPELWTISHLVNLDCRSDSSGVHSENKKLQKAGLQFVQIGDPRVVFPSGRRCVTRKASNSGTIVSNFVTMSTPSRFSISLMSPTAGRNMILICSRQFEYPSRFVWSRKTCRCAAVSRSPSPFLPMETPLRTRGPAPRSARQSLCFLCCHALFAFVVFCKTILHNSKKQARSKITWATWQKASEIVNIEGDISWFGHIGK